MVLCYYKLYCYAEGGTRMNLNWLQSLVYGLVAGLTDILPVSAQAHEVLLLKLFGISGGMEAMNLMIHFGIFAALYFSSQNQIVKINRARALARVPKRRRRRPLDEKSLMDFSLLKTMLLPAAVGILLYRQAMKLQSNLPLIAGALFLNGIALYVPQFLPGSNRDSRMLSRVEGLLMGIGGGMGVIPGFSSLGLAASIGAVCGVEGRFGLNMTLLMNMGITLGLIVHDGISLGQGGTGGMSFMILLRCLAAGIVAFAAAMIAIRLMRSLAKEHGFALFGFYCMGLSLFIFILNLLA